MEKQHSYAVSFCEEETRDSSVMRMILWCTQPFHFLLGHPQFLVILVFCEQPVWSVCVRVCVCVCVCAHAQSYLTLCDPMDCSWPNSSTIQFSRLENWSRLLFPPPRDLSRSGIELHLLYIGRRFFTNCSTGEAQSEVFGLYAFEGKPLRSPALRSTAFQSIAEYTRRSL